MSSYSDPALIVPGSVILQSLGAGATRVAYGTYTGNATADHAIPHGLGRIPRLVIIHFETLLPSYSVVSTIAMPGYFISTTQYIHDSVGAREITPPDATNFYVGDGTGDLDAGNVVGGTYNWVAFG